MKKIFSTLLLTIVAVTASAQATHNMRITFNDGKSVVFGMDTVKTVEFEEKTAEEAKTSYTINGVEYPMPEAVDLGLPSGTKWANMNIGASKPLEHGLCFAWGETKNKKAYTPDTYIFTAGKNPQYSEADQWSHCLYSKYVLNETFGTIDNLSKLMKSDDAATANLGEPWRMPSYADFIELINYCDINIISDGENKFYRISRNGKYIDIPFCVAIDNASFSYCDDQLSFWTNEISGNYKLFTIYGKYWENEVEDFSDNYNDIDIYDISNQYKPTTFLLFKSSETVNNKTVFKVDMEGGDRWVGLPVRPVRPLLENETPAPAPTEEYMTSYTINSVEYPMPNAVDLGLPSGTLWADMDLGTKEEKDYGLLFYYGNIKNCFAYLDENLPNLKNSKEMNVTYPTADGCFTLPTLSQFEELDEYCTKEIIKKGTFSYNLYGADCESDSTYCKFTGPNGNSILMPLSCGEDGDLPWYERGEWWTSSSPYSYKISSEGLCSKNGENYNDFHKIRCVISRKDEE